MAADPVELVAPLTGVMVPIEEVPDPVFSKKMVGDGFSVYPLSGLLTSPVDGEVVDIQDARHAITVRSRDGLEVLMHIGLDTVQMKGEGFELRTRVGEQVKVGDELVAFDLAAVSQRAASVLTQVVIANGERVASIDPVIGIVAGGRDVAARVALVDSGEGAGSVAERAGATAVGAPAGSPGTGAAVGAAVGAAAVGAAAAAVAAVAGSGASSATGESNSVTSEALMVPNPAGLHARPAATLANLAKSFASDIELVHGSDVGNAKSIMAVMALGVGAHDTVQVRATGTDAQQAVDAITAAIREGLGEEVPAVTTPDETGAAQVAPAVPPAPAVAASAEPAAPRSGDSNLLTGVSASPGLGIGTVVQIRPHVVEVVEEAGDHATERQRLDAAVARATAALGHLKESLVGQPDKAAIFDAHAEILADPDLLGTAQTSIAQGKSAEFAWRGAYTDYADRLAGLSNEVLAGRATDVRDVGQRVLEELTGQRRETHELPAGTIIVAEDLTPSDTAQLDRTKVAGFATTTGGASSHVAIIARSLDIPAIAGIEAQALDIADGTRVILDGTAGTLQIGVTEEQVQAVAVRQERAAAKREADLAAAHEDAVTTDGHRVEVVANIGNAEDAAAGVEVGAEGVGLLRSEFAFLERSSAPTEDEQAGMYADVARALRPGQRLVVRTLDVGGDKPLPYLPIPREENPFLGIRGVRVGLERPEVLRTQVRAILRAANEGANLNVMFPMIATLDDFRAAKAVFDDEAQSLGVAGVPLGIMVEVPSVAVMARQFAKEADFFSVGTNDLTSYTLAMDRGHPKLAGQVDPCNPAVLSLIGQAAQAAHDEGTWLGVCGGIASDVQAVPILLGLGVDELSCSIPAIPSVKAAVRAVSMNDCYDLARRAVQADTAAAVRALNPIDEA